MEIGILALQGAFIEHKKVLEKLGVSSFEIRDKTDLSKPMSGLIIPGGESTTMYRLLTDLRMEEYLKKLIKEGLPVFGTCAGLLLLANDVENYKSAFLQTMNIKAVKNAYGRQLGSFRDSGEFINQNIPFVFIRAPYIENVGKSVEVLATYQNKIVAARENNQLVTAFHPELTNDTTVHEYFLSMCRKK
jgi:5'-phosphate synthase pdxT subunit